MDLVATEDCTKETYELQFFGFSSRTVCNYVSSIAVEKIQEATELLQECLLEKLPGKEVAVRSATTQFLKESINAAVQQLKHLPLAVDEFFAIPSFVLLPEDLPQITQYTKEDEQQIDKEIKQLDTRAKRACFMVACLKKEIEVQQQVNRMESELKELEELYREDEKDELLSHDLHSKISKIVEFTKTIKSYEKTCFEFPQQTHDEESDIADRFQKL